MLIGYFFSFCFCAAIFFASSRVIRCPEQAGKWMWWAPHFATAYARIAGRFFWVFSILGMLIVAVAMVLYLI